MQANWDVGTLSCEPPLQQPHHCLRPSELDADAALTAPLSWLEARFPLHGCAAGQPDPVFAPPSHVLLFDSLAERVAPWLQARGYVLRFSLFHTHVPVSSRHGRRVLIYARDM